jgi:gamma-glutamyltranspeptidase
VTGEGLAWPGRAAARGSTGMVATPHSLASAAGLAALRRGGSAVDAAIVANAVLCVVYPHMAGLGGDGFWLIHEEGRGVQALNASGPAAALATVDYYRERGHGDAIPERGALAALTVPGAVDGWRLAHERHGRLDWDALFHDAIRYAREGVAVSRSLGRWLERGVHGSSPRPLAPQLQPELASTLETVARLGARHGFYEGVVAERMGRALERAGSPLRPTDLARFSARWVEPLSADYRGYTAYELPPNTQGFAALQILALLDGFDVAGWGDGSAHYYHHMAEVVKLAFADRDGWLADPDFIDIPLDRLLSPDYVRERRALIDPERAREMAAVEPGVAPPGGGRGRGQAGGDTCYFCVVDDRGMAVSAIQSIYHAFGSGFVAGDTGVLLQNRGVAFELDAAHPNALEPGKRPAHTLIPAMLLRDGAPYLVYGTMGGEGQPQTHAALVTRVVDFGYDVQRAIEAPRWVMGRTWGAPSRDLWLEGRIGDHVARELARRGQPVRTVADWDEMMGHAQAIRVDREHGLLKGGADPRGDGVALGY